MAAGFGQFAALNWIGPLNLFHLLMLGLMLYGLIWWRRGSAQPAGGN